jgi:hypothetical protein
MNGFFKNPVTHGYKRESATRLHCGCQSSNLQIFKSSNFQIFKFSNLQILKFLQLIHIQMCGKISEFEKHIRMSEQDFPLDFPQIAGYADAKVGHICRKLQNMR